MLLQTQFNAKSNVCYYMHTSIDEEDGTIGLILARKDTQLSIDNIKYFDFNYESKEGILEQEKIERNNEFLEGKNKWYKLSFKCLNMI